MKRRPARAEKSRAREYSAPRLYEIAFDMNRKGEVDYVEDLGGASFKVRRDR